LEHEEVASGIESATLRCLAEGTVEVLLGAVDGGSLPNGGLSALAIAESLVVSGLPPSTVLGACETAAGLVWRLVSDELANMRLDRVVFTQLMVAVGETVFDMSAKLGEALRRRLMSTRIGIAEVRGEDPRLTVFDSLLVSPHLGERTLRDAAKRVGYRLGDAHVVALLALRGKGDVARWKGCLGQSAELTSVVSRVQLGSEDPIVEVRASEVVLIYPMHRERGDKSLADRLGSAVCEARLPKGVEVVVTVGRLVEGAVGIAASYAQARRALDAVAATKYADRAVSYEKMLPVLLLLDNPRLAADIRRSALEPLIRQDEERGRDLVMTLRVLIETGGNASAAAASLRIHRHTLSGRLASIERLTGLKLRNHGDLLLLELGLRTLDLSPDEQASPVRQAGPAGSSCAGRAGVA
jgi:hypothetical protein